MKLNEIHTVIKSKVGNEAIACAIKLPWVAEMVTQTMRTITSIPLAYPTTDPKIDVGLSFDMSAFNIHINNGGIIMEGLKPIIELWEPGTARDPENRYNSITLSFNSIPIELIVMKNKALFSITFPIDRPAVHRAIPNLIAVNRQFASIEDYLIKEQAILFQTVYNEIVDAFVQSIKVPDILPSLGAFSMVAPFNYYYEGDYMILSGIFQTTSEANCHCRSSAVVRTETRNGNTIHVSGDTQIPLNPRIAIPDIDMPDIVYYYPKSVTFDAFSESLLKPAIIAGKEGFALMAFKWHWNLATGLKEGIDITLDILGQKINVNAPLKAFGEAGIGIKIACVYQSIANGSLNGTINPCTLQLGLNLDAGNNIVMKANFSYDVDIDLSILPVLDIILDILLDSVMDDLIRDRLEEQLKLFNVKLIDLNKVLPYWKYWDTSQHFTSDSIAIGVRRYNG